MSTKLTRPWSVQIELAEGCSRICPFCGINGIREKPGNYNFMTIETADTLAKQCARFCPESRYEFAMHGEPTMNPHYLEMFGIFRTHLPNAQLQLTTNGVKFRKSVDHMRVRVEEIFDFGIDFIILDTYWPERDTLRKYAFQLKDEGYDVVDFYEELVPNGESPWYNHHRKWQNRIVLMDDLLKRDGEVRSRVIYNHAGNAAMKPPLDEPLHKTCTMPFRELSFRWDGSVALCCHDWKGEYKISNIHDDNIEDIWNHKRFEAARTFLQNKMRAFNPCVYCDVDSGARAGLLPKYEYPTKDDALIVLETIEENPIRVKVTEDFQDVIDS